MLVVSGEFSIFSYLGFHFYWGQCSHINKGLWAVIGTLMVDLLLANKKCKHLRHGLGRRKGLWFSASDARTGISFRQSQVPTEGLETSQELTKPPLPKVLQGLPLAHRMQPELHRTCWAVHNPTDRPAHLQLLSTLQTHSQPAGPWNSAEIISFHSIALSLPRVPFPLSWLSSNFTLDWVSNGATMLPFCLSCTYSYQSIYCIAVFACLLIFSGRLRDWTEIMVNSPFYHRTQHTGSLINTQGRLN